MKDILSPIIRIIAVSLSVIFAGTAAMGSLMSSSVTATQHQRVHPVLIRNDNNALLQIRIESLEKSVFLHSLTFSLAGTDDRDDLGSLQIYLSRQEEKFKTKDTFANILDPIYYKYLSEYNCLLSLPL